MTEKKHRILFQAGVIIIVIFTVLAIVNGYSIYKSSEENYINMLHTQCGQYLTQTRAEMLDYESLPWLMEYWQTNRDRIHLAGDAKERASFLSSMFDDRGIVSLKDVTTEQAEAFTDEEKHYFAEGCYLEIMPKFTEFKQSFNLTDLTCVKLKDEATAIPLFKAVGEEELTEEKDFALGQEWPFSPELHPAITEMYNLHEDRAYFEQVTSTTNGVEYLFGYVPIIINDEIAAYINAYFPIDDLRVNIAQSTERIEIINATLLLGSALVMLLMLYQAILRPLTIVGHSVREYRETKDSKPIVENLSRLRSKNEVGRMADDFSDMAVELEKYSTDMIALTAENERVSTELNMAANIQLNMLPNIFPAYPSRSEFDIYATMEPAKEVGGDFYDFFLIDKDTLGIVVADVSGKGVPAALFMMISKTMIKTQAQSGTDPAKTLTVVNAMLGENNEDDMFVTVWHGVLDIPSGKLTYCDAGHEKLGIYRGETWELLPKAKKSFPVAFLDGEFLAEMPDEEQYKNVTVELRPGDVIFQYTDGVTEATDSSEELFGEERILEALNSAESTHPQDILPKVRGAIDDFVKDAPQFDDITMLAIEYLGTK